MLLVGIVRTFKFVLRIFVMRVNLFANYSSSDYREFGLVEESEESDYVIGDFDDELTSYLESRGKSLDEDPIEQCKTFDTKDSIIRGVMETRAQIDKYVLGKAIVTVVKVEYIDDWPPGGVPSRSSLVVHIDADKRLAERVATDLSKLIPKVSRTREKNKSYWSHSRVKVRDRFAENLKESFENILHA